MPRIHLVTYATPRFRLRQLILGASARVNGVVDTVTSWTPEMLLKAGFEQRCKGIKLSERGSGFWAWKPFVIDAKLLEIPDGDLVFYCDVGRLYPFKLLEQSATPFVKWMNLRGQDMMPGVEIPWDGPNALWTKREALVATGMDHREVREASPIQASFSLWKASQSSRAFVTRWLDWCSQRGLVSDDPSQRGLEELPGFREHRHDQALLTLCCLKEGISALNIGSARPEIDTRHPCQVSRLLAGEVPAAQSVRGAVVRLIAWPMWQIEKRIRHLVKFGEPINK
ncbi:MAG: hypothetical protein V4819_21810 [Verrucomicrobiota bacterium]